MESLQSFVEQFTYLGVFLVLLAGSLGLPIPEEMAIIAAGVMSHEGLIAAWPALVVCVLGVLSGDVVLYWTGRNGGERVLNWRAVPLSGIDSSNLTLAFSFADYRSRSTEPSHAATHR